MSIKFTLTFATAIILPTLASKLYDYMGKYSNKQTDKRVRFTDEQKQDKSLYMIIFGLILMVYGIYMASVQGCNAIASGITLGGFFILLNNVLFNWKTFGIERQILILSSAMFILTYVGTNEKIISTSYFC